MLLLRISAFINGIRRYIRTIMDGTLFSRVKPTAEKYERGRQLPVQLSCEKTFPEYAAESKRRSTEPAFSEINYLEIAPGEVFSFWAVLGKPGRQLAGRPGRVYGGGLDDLAGIIYLLALQCGMEIVERHAHRWLDHFRETSPRPGGFDAWVVFGYKDLVFRNNKSYPVAFRFVWDGPMLRGELCAPQGITTWELYSEQERQADKIHVRTWRSNESGFRQRISTDVYRPLSGLRKLTRQRSTSGS